MKIAFIRQIEECLHQLERLTERSKEDDSTFKYHIETAKDYIQKVSDTYHEVLHRDSTEDESYTPPLKEIK